MAKRENKIKKGNIKALDKLNVAEFEQRMTHKCSITHKSLDNSACNTVRHLWTENGSMAQRQLALLVTAQYLSYLNLT